MKYGIIGGTGVYEIPDISEKKTISTQYGDAEVYIIRRGEMELVFLPRHGRQHSKPPHLINYRANLKALHDLGVEYVYSTSEVASCNILYEPGDIVMVEDFLDFTKTRPTTFFDSIRENGQIKYLNMSEPYCKKLKGEFYTRAKLKGLTVKGDVVYGCIDGPRFPTAAEVKMYEALGADIIGMTTIPEVILAKELGMCYSTIALVGEWTTGYNGEFSRKNLAEIISSQKRDIFEIFFKVFETGLDYELCNCKDAVVKR